MTALTLLLFNHHSAVMRAEGVTPQGLYAFRLYVDSVRTRVVVTSGAQEVAPTVQVEEASGGMLFGTIDVTGSGAYIQSLETAFVSDRGKVWSVPGHKVAGHYRDRVLIVPNKFGPWEVADNAYVYVKGRPVSIGLTTEAAFEKDGSVSGWYWRDSRGKPFRGMLLDASGVFKQHFIWKHGRRTSTGTSPAST